MPDFYYSGQGIVYVGDRNPTTGLIHTVVDVGNCPNLVVSLETDVTEHKESRSGNRLVDFRLVTETRANVTMTLEVFKKENLLIALYGTNGTQTTSAVTNETLDTVVVNDFVTSQKKPFTTLSITDSAGIPATLTLNTHYKVISAHAGIIQFINLAAFTQPFKLNYTPVAKDQTTILSQPYKERFLIFQGLNTANSSDPVTVELYRVIFDPAGNLSLINDELGQFELTGSALYDSTRVADTTLGPFGRVIQNTP